MTNYQADNKEDLYDIVAASQVSTVVLWDGRTVRSSATLKDADLETGEDYFLDPGTVAPFVDGLLDEKRRFVVSVGTDDMVRVLEWSIAVPAEA